MTKSLKSLAQNAKPKNVLKSKIQRSPTDTTLKAPAASYGRYEPVFSQVAADRVAIWNNIRQNVSMKFAIAGELLEMSGDLMFPTLKRMVFEPSKDRAYWVVIPDGLDESNDPPVTDENHIWWSGQKS